MWKLEVICATRYVRQAIVLSLLGLCLDVGHAQGLVASDPNAVSPSLPAMSASGCGQIILSGGGDICEGNCPEMPNFINFEVIGSDLPFYIDIVITNSIFGSFQIDDLPVTNGQNLNICLDGLFPSFDPATNTLTVPILAIGLTASVTVINAETNSGCPVTVEPNSVSIEFIEAPEVNVGSDQTICAGETVNVTSTIGGSAASSLWTTTGDGAFDDPEALNTTYTPGPGDIANGSVVLVATSVDEEMACIPAMASMEVTIEGTVEVLVVTPVTICNNAIADIEAMVSGPAVDMTWTTSGDGVFGDPESPSTTYAPGFGDIDDGTVILTYAPVDPDQCVGEIQSVVLNIVPAPTANVPLSLEVCSDDSIDIMISIQGDYGTVTWTATGDGTLIVFNDEEVNYTPGPQDIDDQFTVITVTVTSIYPECGQTLYVIPLNVISCECPPFELVPPAMPLCSTADTLLLSSLIIEGGNGTWSATGFPSGSSPAFIQGGQFITAMSDPGIYTLTYTLSFPEAGCPAAQSVDILVEDGLAFQPDLGPDIQRCGAQPVTLQASFAGGPPISYTWVSLGDGLWTPDPANPAEIATYLPGPLDSLNGSVALVYTAFSSVCPPVADTLIVSYLQEPVAALSIDTIGTCNMTGMGSVLDLDALVIGIDTSGTWTELTASMVDLSAPDSVDFDGVMAGYYTFVFTTTSAVPPCRDQSDTVVVHVMDCLCPMLQITNPEQGVCQDVSALPLDAFIMAGGPGTWSIVQSPPGTQPATISGSILTINGCDPGAYRLRFTLDAAPLPACPDSAEMILFVQELPAVIVDWDTASCGQLPVSVSAMSGGSASGVVWSTSGLGIFQDPMALSTIYLPAMTDVASAQVRLSATTVDTFGYCAPVADTLTIQLITPPSTRFSSRGDTLCTDPDSNQIVNLTALIVEGDGTGTWSAPAGQPDVSDPSNVDFSGLPAGSYSILYTTMTAVAPCVDSVYTFTYVRENCGCPPIVLDPSDITLCGDTVLDLSPILLDGGAGTWAVTLGPPGAWPAINGNKLDATGAAAGLYRLTYTLLDSVPACPASASVLFEVEGIPAWTVLSLECTPDVMYYTAIVQTTGAWVTADTGLVTDNQNGTFTIDSIPAGLTVAGEFGSITGLCGFPFTIAAPDCNCTLMLEDIADTITFCPGDTFVLIPIVTGAMGLAFATWVTPYGTFMRPTLPLHTEGDYIWIVRDMAGCEERDSFYAKFLGPESIVFDVELPSCPGRPDGAIIVEGLPGGDPPFTLSLDGGPPRFTATFPVRFDGLDAGQHVIQAVDANGCVKDTTLILDAPSPGTLDLGPDRSVALGDSTQITPMWSGMVPLSWIWMPAVGSPDGAPFWVTPADDIALSAVVTDTSGCVYRDTVVIRVFEEARVYVPNVFSPNGDQLNDAFVISANDAGVSFESLEIFDRWGGLLYGQYEGTPLAWDGRSDGQPALTGVYAWKLVYMTVDGARVVRFGDVTLMR